jgi:SNF2 family DNA or RNA helicase
MGIIKRNGKIVKVGSQRRRSIETRQFDYKLLSLEDLEYLFQDVAPIMFAKTTPKKHQYASLGFASEKDRVGFIHGIGTGKTLCSIWTSWMWGCKKNLVVGPSSSFDAWERDLSKYTDFSYIFLKGTTTERRLCLEKEFDYYIIQYEGLKTIFGDFVYKCPYCTLQWTSQDDSDKEGSAKQKAMEHYKKCSYTPKKEEDKKPLWKGWVINYDRIGNQFNCLHLDEVHRASGEASKQSEIIYQLSWRAKKLVALTGSPLNKRTKDANLLKMWHIMRVIDLGATLGNNFFKYRNAYFKQYGFEWKLKSGCEEKILKKIASACIRYTKEECIDLQEPVRKRINVDPTPEQLKLEESIIQSDCLYLKDLTINTEGPLVKPQKLKQICSGFIYGVTPDGSKGSFPVPTNKFKELEYLLQEIDEKVIIFFEYVEEGDLLIDWCKKNHYHFTTIRGKDSKEERSTNYKNFVNNKKIQILLGQMSCCSESLELVVSRIVIFFAQAEKSLTREQCEGRVLREFQTKQCIIIDIVVKNSAEEISFVHRDDETKATNAILEYIKMKGGIVDHPT